MLELTRRAFLRLFANSSFAVAVGGQFPDKWLSPPLPPEENRNMAERLIYATTCRECPAGCGMHVSHVNGRAIKAEGSPDHPVGQGGLCARGQSALQGIYDPDRLRQPLRRGAPARNFPDTGLTPASWQEALLAIGNRLQSGKGRVLVISGLETGTLADILAAFAERFNGRLLIHEPFDYQPLRDAHAGLTGRAVIPWYGLDHCRHIISFGADFLESWLSNVQFTAMFSRMHAFQGAATGRFTYVGPRLSMTAANADDFIQIAPGQEVRVAKGLLRIMVEQGWVTRGREQLAAYSREARPEELPLENGMKRLVRLAREFSRAEAAVALPGPAHGAGEEARRLAEAVFLLNYATGRVGQGLDFSRIHALSSCHPDLELYRSLDDLTPEDVVFLHGANPAYSRPWLAELLKRAGLVVSLSQLADETALLADWVLPVDHPLESWGEYTPWTGIHSLVQPAMRRLYDSRPAGDIFLSLADMAGRPLQRGADGGTDNNFYSWLQADWGQRDGQGAAARQELLARGFALSPPQPEKELQISLEQLEVATAPPREIDHAPHRAALVLWPSIFFFDGRTANRSWLQENPHPISFIAWSSWLDIHPDRATALGLADGDLVKMTTAGTVATLPARLTAEMHPEAVGLVLGQGHWAMGEVAAGRGVNGFAFLKGETGGNGSVTVSLEKTGGKEPLICLGASFDQHGRDLLRWQKLGDAPAAGPGREQVTLPLPAGYERVNDLYQGHQHARHRWAMVIDLQRCIGCAACSVACYAENNIAVLGPKALRQGREMSWLKVVPYRHPEKKNMVGFLPLPCQHCDQAPCEPVCPVFAAVHTEDGLNAQVYNRCVGTRYCSNNCPYKVRHFNWYNIDWQKSLQWQLNPDVTVRCRGVMEKCTFCVQRLRRAEQQAKVQGRELTEAEVQPACVQSCPARALVFGDLLDEKSEVRRLFQEDRRGYQLLHELNTKPAVLYLQRIEQD